MEQLFTHQPAGRHKDKVCDRVCGQCIIKWQDAATELLDHPAHSRELSEPSDRRLHGWVSCSGQRVLRENALGSKTRSGCVGMRRENLFALVLHVCSIQSQKSKLGLGRISG